MKRSVFNLLVKIHKITDKLWEFWTHLNFSVRKKKLSSLKQKNQEKATGEWINATHFYHNLYKPKEGATSHWETAQLVSQSTLKALLFSELQQPWVPRPDTEATFLPHARPGSWDNSTCLFSAGFPVFVANFDPSRPSGALQTPALWDFLHILTCGCLRWCETALMHFCCRYKHYINFPKECIQENKNDSYLTAYGHHWMRKIKIIQIIQKPCLSSTKCIIN